VPEVRAHAGRHRVRYLWLPAALIVTAAAAAAVIPPGLAGWLLLPYFCWQFFHYQKQNLGMAALAAAGSGIAPLRAIERRALLGTGLAGIAGLIARPGLLQLRAGPGLPPLLPFAAAGFAISAAAGLAALARRPAASRPAGFCVLYLISLLFPLPVFAFGSPYAAVGGMTAAHGLQYLLLVGLVAGGGQRRLTSLALLANIALAGGAVLAWAAHLHNAGPAGRLLFGAYLGVVMAHFVIDAGFWRLRAEFPRAFLTGRLPYLLAVPPVAAPPVAAPAAAIPAADLSSTDIGWRA
jgi:hypothetical protein